MLNQIQPSPGRPPLLTLKNGLGAREHTRLQALGVLAQKRHDLACTVFVKRKRSGSSDSLQHFAPVQPKPSPPEEQVRARKTRSRKGAYLRLPSIRSR